MWQAYKGPGKFKFVGTFNPSTLDYINRLLLPARWGWQYVTAELLAADGSVLKAYPDIIDQATDRSWYGDLNPGTSMTSRFVFPSDTAKSPRALHPNPTLDRPEFAIHERH